MSWVELHETNALGQQERGNRSKRGEERCANGREHDEGGEDSLYTRRKMAYKDCADASAVHGHGQKQIEVDLGR